MKNIYANNLNALLFAIDALDKISKKTEKSDEEPFKHICTMANNTIALLTTPANSLDNKGRNVNFSNDKGWISFMQIVNRSILSLIHSATEQALLEIHHRDKIKYNSQVQKILDDPNFKLLSQENTKYIKSLLSKKTSFNDIMESVIKKSNIIDSQKKKWRKFFLCLSIIRNKTSHADTTLTEWERVQLTNHGFLDCINSQELKFDPIVFPQILERIILFFQDLGLKII